MGQRRRFAWGFKLEVARLLRERDISFTLPVIRKQNL
jgi:hypothetical protein